MRVNGLLKKVKYCKGCKKTKAIQYFDIRMADGVKHLQSRCQPCTTKYNADYYVRKDKALRPFDIEKAVVLYIDKAWSIRRIAQYFRVSWHTVNKRLHQRLEPLL